MTDSPQDACQVDVDPIVFPRVDHFLKTPWHRTHCSLVKGGVVRHGGGHVGWDHACDAQNKDTMSHKTQPAPL